MSKFKNQENVIFKIFYTVIFATRNRAEIIGLDDYDHLANIFREICISWGCELESMAGGGDYVELTIEANPKIDLTRMIGAMRQISSRYSSIKTKRGAPGLWSESCGLISGKDKSEIYELIDLVLKRVDEESSQPSDLEILEKS